MSTSKLVFFDVDGTLLNDKKMINESTINAIEFLKQKDFIFCLATGRHFTNNILEIAKLAKLNGYLVLANGNHIWDIKNEVLTTIGLPIPQLVVDKFVSVAQKIKRQLNICFLDGTSKTYFFGDDISAISDPYFFIFGQTINHFDSITHLPEYLQKPIVHISVKAESDLIKKVAHEFDEIKASKQAQISCVANIYIEADSYGISKWNGCSYVQNKLQISKENTYAFGDSGNDIIMFENVGHSICMANANDFVKQHVETVIGDNNSDAIAEYLLSLVQ